jgi:hypothetical protein
VTLAERRDGGQGLQGIRIAQNFQAWSGCRERGAATAATIPGVKCSAWALAGAGLAALVGCGGSETKRYAVTVLDPAKIDCKAAARNGKDPEGTKDLADDIEEGWAAAFALTPPMPVGRVLNVVSRGDDELSAWFDTPVSIPLDQFGGTEEVMLGEPHDDYVEAVFRRVLQVTDDEAIAETLGLEPCGELETATSTLAITVDGPEVEGRVRRVQRSYQSVGYLPCDESVTCPRDLAIAGVEIED